MTPPPDIPPIIAILRGVTPTDILAVADALTECGIEGIEVPLNSPDAMSSIRRLSASHGDLTLCGAGTVMNVDQVEAVKAAGGRLIVAPNTDPRVIRRAVEMELTVIPGFATATEAFTALEAGAQALKLFPAATYGSAHVTALRAVLPPGTRIYAVGGVSADTLPQWLAAGIDGIGVGSEIYAPGRTIADVKQRARSVVAAFRCAPH